MVEHNAEEGLLGGLYPNKVIPTHLYLLHAECAKAVKADVSLRLPELDPYYTWTYVVMAWDYDPI